MTLVELYQKAVKEYTKSPVEWKGLLSNVARFYKQSFDNAVLIYAQKPNATQLATFKEWHDERIGRSVNKGAKGIAVLDMSNPRASFKYLFDFMDTNGTEESFQNVMKYLWSLEKEYQIDVLERLRERYLVDGTSIEECLYHLCKQRVENIMTPHMETFEIRDQESILYELPKEAVKAEFLEILTDSVAYTVLKKCNVSTEILEQNHFETIEHFNTVGIFMTLGGVTVSIARPILNEIQKDIQSIKEERSEGYANRTIDEVPIRREEWHEVSKSTDFRREQQGNTSRTVRKTVESIYDGEVSSPSRRTNSDRTNGTDDAYGRRGSGAIQGNNDTEHIEPATNSKRDRSFGESKAYEPSNDNSRGEDKVRVRDETEIKETEQIELEEQQNKEETRQSPIEENKSSMGDLLYQETSQQTKEEITVEDKSVGQMSFFEVSKEQRSEVRKEEVTEPSHVPKRNYQFKEEHHLYENGEKAKCRNNIEAIRLVKKLEKEGRYANEEEQMVLAKYVGWGGLANALTKGKSGWEKEYQEIKSLLTEEEFVSAQESTITAYYTEQMIIQGMYSALEKFGFHGGNILDPAMGVGSFFSVLPKSMKDSKLYGVELDSISGKIAKQLYQQAEIQIKGFEETNYPNQFFDVVIGNIPFNSIYVNDKKYDKYHFHIHDYFLAKSIDQVRAGGIVAVITSKYTLDKANPKIRKYLAQRAELLGAIRLPDHAFKRIAGTQVTTDILFLQKREREIVPSEEECSWLSIEKNEDGIPMNTYFIEHPEMVLGEMIFDNGRFGNDTTTACRGDGNLEEQLKEAIARLQGNYQEATSEYSEEEEKSVQALPADPNIRNFSYALVNGTLYFQENSRMYKQEIGGKKEERIKGMVKIAQVVRELIEFQTDPPVGGEEYEEELKGKIQKLNRVYDSFVETYGYLNAKANVHAFSQDVNAPLLRSIEIEKKEEKGVFEKTPIFYKATIKPKVIPKTVYSAEDALKISLNMKGNVDLSYMESLYELPNGERATKDQIIEELGNKIYQEPVESMGEPYRSWQTAEEYLSGYVKDKLAEAMLKAKEDPEHFERNVEALQKVQPIPLTPSDISFTLGSTWIPTEIYEDFMYEVLKTYNYNKVGRNRIGIEFSDYTGGYYISNKGMEQESIPVNQIYGTERMNAYEILETTLNLRNPEIKDRYEYFDPVTGEEKVKYVLNRKETILAREKQAQLKNEFETWLFQEPKRGEDLTKLYNEKFNTVRPREYDGSELLFPDMADDIELRKHQRDVIAHGLYGKGNLLIAHEVGAGKTFSSIALAYELKRLGKINKPLFAVPNHLVGQWANEYMRLYPNANILVAEKKDLEKKNRKRFASRIAVGDYDAIIMAHSSFERIPLSRERQLSAMAEELEEVTKAIEYEKMETGQSWSLKQMKIFQKNLQHRYDTLYKEEKKDDVINFEELGVDALIVDEAHAYKNNFSYTKMRNVAGITNSSSQRAMDMHMKAQYINEIGNGKGVIYLTGTPVSNSMAELYVMQKTLQPQELKRRGVMMFDSWASTFGKIESSLEIKPEGNGYQMKNRFAKFHNLPELMNMFQMIADIKTADMLDLPVPRLKNDEVQVIRTKITPEQKKIVESFGERAELIRSGEVDSSEDNFLKLTLEARLLSIDPRALDEEIPNVPETKLNICANKVADIYFETEEERLTQLIFCDQGTPKNDGKFNFYDAVKNVLLERGVKEEEVAFIHDAKTDVQREELFDKVRNGEVRILMGSTQKMGTGMNVQQRLIALHHLDVPWRPADLTQRNGRILRQGNQNEEVSIYNYITENTFDAYLWQILEQKQKYISQIMTGRSALRTCEDMDDTVLQYAEFKSMAISDPRIKEKMETDNEISRLMILKSSWQSQRNELLRKISTVYPNEIERLMKKQAKVEKDLLLYEKNKPMDFEIKIGKKQYMDRSEASEHFTILKNRLGYELGDPISIGEYAGFRISLIRSIGEQIEIQLSGEANYITEAGVSSLGNITRIEHLAERIIKEKEVIETKLEEIKQQLKEAKLECEKPFSEEERLEALQKRKVELDLAIEFKEEVEEDLEKSEKSQDNTEELHQEERLYQKLKVFAEPIVNGEAYYMRFTAPYMDDLVIECYEGVGSITHYYEQNGDLMKEPDVTFQIVKEDDISYLYPTSFTQDSMGVFYRTDEVGQEVVKDLESFMEEWFDNLINNTAWKLEEVEYRTEMEQEYER